MQSGLIFYLHYFLVTLSWFGNGLFGGFLIGRKRETDFIKSLQQSHICFAFKLSMSLFLKQHFQKLLFPKYWVCLVFFFVSTTALLYCWDQNLVLLFCFKTVIWYLEKGCLYRKTPEAHAWGGTVGTYLATHGVTPPPPPPSAQQLIFLAISPTSLGFSQIILLRQRTIQRGKN